MGKFIDLSGRKFGRLLVVQRSEDYVSPNGHHVVCWECECDCGTKHYIVSGNSLKKGSTSSCGCISKEFPKHKTHGQSKTQLYKEWCDIKKRCYNSKSKSYPDYGMRGITLCQEWHDYVKYYAYVSVLPHFQEKGYTLNRIDNNGNYEPGNVEWATKAEQANNRRSSRLLEYNEKRQTIAQWSAEIGIEQTTLSARLRMGWSIEKALTTPLKNKKQKVAT